MSKLQSLYGTNGQPITVTFTALANNNMRQSAVVDNTPAANLFLGALVALKFKTNAAGTSGTGYVAVYAYGTADGGADYTDGASGADAAFTPTNPPNIRLIGIINAVANSTTYEGGPMAVEPAFGGILPDHWGIIIENQTGAALDGSVASAWYQGYSNQVN